MAKRALVQILGENYNKTAFGKKWKSLVEKPVGFRFSRADQEFISEAVSFNPAWEKIILRGGNFYFKVIKKKFQTKAVKGIALVTQNSSNEIWIGKKKLIDILFPPPKVEYQQEIGLFNDPVENRRRVLSALRQIIEPQIKQYRQAVRRRIKGVGRYKLRCALTGEYLNHGEYHIDHKTPFKVLVEDWCRINQVDLENIEVVCRGTFCQLKNKSLAENFFDYHLLNAELQVTTAQANLVKGSKIV